MENSTVFGNVSQETILGACNERTSNTRQLLYAVNISACVVNCIVLLVTTLVNLMILLAVWRNPNLRSASMVLLCGLAILNLGTGLVSQPLYLTIKVLEIRNNSRRCDFLVPFETSVYIFTGMSLCTLASIGLDRVLAISLRVTYKQVVTIKRVTLVLLMEFLVSGSLLVIQMFNSNLARLVIVILAFTLVLFICVAYFMVFYKLRRYQGLTRPFTDSTVGQDRAYHTGIDMGKYCRSVKTAILVAALTVLCYLPNIFVQINVLLSSTGYQDTHVVLQTITVTVVMANGAANPLLYIFRMENLRNAVKEILRKSR